MKQLVAFTVVLMMCVSLASAAIDPGNPDWLIYRDPFGTGDTGDPSYYDQYAEVLPGDTLTLHVVVNFNTGDWTQIYSYHSAFWYDPAVVQNCPTPNYDYAWLGGMADPASAQYQVNGYVQLYNYGSAQNAWEEPASAPFVLLSWDLQISATAPLGATTIPMRWRSYNINAASYGPQDWNQIGAHYIEHDPVFTINVMAPEPPPPGDYDGDYDIDAVDIDILADAIEAGSTDLTYDVNGDSLIDEADMIQHVATLVERTDGGVGTYRGDFNLDGYVDGTDLAILKAGFGLTGLGYAAGNCNADDFVNGTDLAIFKATFGFSGTPGDGGNPPAVPEPATLSLLGLGAAALLRRRSR
jgi:hypothetical protein